MYKPDDAQNDDATYDTDDDCQAVFMAHGVVGREGDDAGHFEVGEGGIKSCLLMFS